MSKLFEGKVSVILNTKGEIALRRDKEGRFDAENARELYEMMLKLAKSHKASINKYALFIAAKDGDPVLLANRYGNPYVALLPKREENQQTRKITKLA